jgi:UDP-3-O-[3-hydroxymyristoyl] glucosamine N-acyltransferase
MAQRMIDIEDILATRKIDYEIAGRKNQVTGVSSLQEANENDLSFCSSRGDKAIKEIAASRAALIFCNSDLKGRIAPGTSQGLIFVDNPRLSFIRTVNHIHAEAAERGVSSRAVIAKSARIGSNCRIGDFAIIGDDCIVGDNTIVEDRVTLVQQCRVGRNCTIQSDVVIGHDGFAYERLPDGFRVPDRQGVAIGYRNRRWHKARRTCIRRA